MFKKYFLAKKIESYLKCSTEILYSEKYDFSVDKNQYLGDMVTDIIKSQENIANLILAYIAISIVAKNKFPFDKLDINKAIKDYNFALIELEIPEMQLNTIEIWRLRALTEILKFDLDVTIGKVAYEHNKYSYEGIVYHMSKINKGPLTITKKQELRNMTSELSNTEALIKESEEN